MQRTKTCFCVALVLSFAVLTIPAQSDDEAEIYDLVNRERVRSRLVPLAWDDKLARLARSYSRQMAREGFFGHYDRNGRSVSDRSREAGAGRWRKIGENLFMVTEHPQFTVLSVRGWMRSASHRRNIQDRSWTATGVGIARSRDDQIFVTQVFVSR